jgi:hypothetical protein
MSNLLPDIGRNGIVNSVRRLSGASNPGYRKVDSDAEFIAGQVAKLAEDASGNPVLKVADADDTNIIGIFFCHKVTSFYRPVVSEAQTFGTDPNTAWLVYLDHANLRASSAIITDADGDAYTVTTDYTVNTTNGVITRTSTGDIGATDTIYVTYSYSDPNLSGIDQTLGSGMAATLEDSGELATLVYDTSVAYTLMGSLYVNSAGYITATDGGGSKIGVVTKVPTSDNPELHYKLQLA